MDAEKKRRLRRGWQKELKKLRFWYWKAITSRTGGKIAYLTLFLGTGIYRQCVRALFRKRNFIKKVRETNEIFVSVRIFIWIFLVFLFGKHEHRFHSNTYVVPSIFFRPGDASAPALEIICFSVNFCPAGLHGSIIVEVIPVVFIIEPLRFSRTAQL